MQTLSRTRRITYTAILAAIATVVMFFEFPLPFMPPFLKVDFSGAIILTTAYLLGLVPALVAALIKGLIHLLSTQTGGVGELADFIMTSAFVCVAYGLFGRKKTGKRMLVACLGGTVTMGIVGVLTNHFLLIPFYSMIMPIDKIIAACTAMNPMIDSLNAYLLFGVFPFNLIKGALLSVLTVVMVPRLQKYVGQNRKMPGGIPCQSES